METNRSDTEIQKDVLEELKWDPRVVASEIGVIVKEGVATLTGHVDSYAERWAAEHAAHRVRDVKAVASDIEVQAPMPTERTDGDIARAAAQALEWDVTVPSEKIEVTVSGGWVSLQGEVERPFQRLAAEQALRNLSGVKGITNLIAVQPMPSPVEDSAIKDGIERALARMAETDAERIKVEVEDSKVILRGTVRSPSERKAAEEAAWMAPGVTIVDNYLAVIP